MTTNDKYDPNKQTCASWDCKNLARPGYSHCDEHLKAVNDSDELDARSYSKIMKSSEPVDRLARYISSLSPHNLWKATEAIDSYCEQRVREAHMQGWHEGRTAANNPQMVYTFTTGIAHITEKGDRE